MISSVRIRWNNGRPQVISQDRPKTNYLLAPDIRRGLSSLKTEAQFNELMKRFYVKAIRFIDANQAWVDGQFGLPGGTTQVPVRPHFQLGSVVTKSEIEGMIEEDVELKKREFIETELDNLRKDRDRLKTKADEAINKLKEAISKDDSFKHKASTVIPKLDKNYDELKVRLFSDDCLLIDLKKTSLNHQPQSSTDEHESKENECLERIEKVNSEMFADISDCSKHSVAEGLKMVLREVVVNKQRIVDCRQQQIGAHNASLYRQFNLAKQSTHSAFFGVRPSAPKVFWNRPIIVQDGANGPVHHFKSHYFAAHNKNNTKEVDQYLRLLSSNMMGKACFDSLGLTQNIKDRVLGASQCDQYTGTLVIGAHCSTGKTKEIQDLRSIRYDGDSTDYIITKAILGGVFIGFLQFRGETPNEILQSPDISSISNSKRFNQVFPNSFEAVNCEFISQGAIVGIKRQMSTEQSNPLYSVDSLFNAYENWFSVMMKGASGIPIAYEVTELNRFKAEEQKQ